MSGYDAPVHLSEQCLKAKKAVPKAIITTSIFGALLGLFAVLVIAYSIMDIKAVVGPDVDQPMAIFVVQVLGKKTGLAIFSLIIACCIFEGQACMIISSRLVYACSRDRILPGWQIFRKYNIQTLVSASIFKSKSLLTIAWIDCVIGIVLNSLVFVGPVAVNAIFSIGVTAQYVAFIIPIALRLFNPQRFLQFSSNSYWNLGDKYSYVWGILGILWCLFIIPVLSFPAVRGSDLTLELMNWTVVVYGGTMSFALIWYAIYARKDFKVPERGQSYLL
jgi:amino acid transporter